MDYSKLTTKEKIELLNKAKDAYYNSYKEILSDAEFDELEKEVGLENKNYIGSAAGNYEIKHSIPMGSLSKTQVKEETEKKNEGMSLSDLFEEANNKKK